MEQIKRFKYNIKRAVKKALPNDFQVALYNAPLIGYLYNKRKVNALRKLYGNTKDRELSELITFQVKHNGRQPVGGY